MSLTIGGVNVPVEGLDEQEPHRIGGNYVRSFTGVVASPIRGIKRQFRVRTSWLTDTEFTAIRAKVDLTTDQTIGGTFLPFTTGRTQLQGSTFLSDSDGKRRNMTFLVLEA